jgi:hypothetical protein
VSDPGDVLLGRAELERAFARVRRGFRNIRAALPHLTSAPKPGKPGPGRPPGSKNRHPAPRHDVGKTTTRARSLKAQRERAG